MPQFNFDKNYIKYIIFDMDGVLINSEPVTVKAALKALSEIGIVATPDDFKPFIGAGEDKFITEICKKHKKDNMIASTMSRMYELYNQYVFEDLTVYPSVHQVILTLKESGFHLGIASSAAAEKLSVSLKAANIDPELFDVIITGSDVSEKKPSPEIYFTAMDELDADPEECIIVEDAINGIRAAIASGAYCFGVTTSFSKEILENEGPDFIGVDIIELLDILK